MSKLKSMPIVFAWFEAVYVVFFGLFLVALLLGQPRYGRILAWGPLVFMGKISYGIYLFHVIALNVVQLGMKMILPGVVGSRVGSMIELFIGGFLSVSIAYIMHVKIEQPLVALGWDLSQRIMRRKSVEEPVAIVGTSG